MLKFDLSYNVPDGYTIRDFYNNWRELVKIPESENLNSSELSSLIAKINPKNYYQFHVSIWDYNNIFFDPVLLWQGNLEHFLSLQFVEK